MEDILKFLVVAAVLVVAFVRQTRKEARKKAARRPAVPPPRPQADATYGGFIPEGPAPDEPAPRAEGQRSTPTAPPAAAPAPPAAPDEGPASDYAIRTADEARRAIVWGEILRRKY